MTVYVPDRRKSDRRISPRLPVSGGVKISFEDPNPVTIEAELIEASATGFRAGHDSKEITPGLEVHFKRGDVSGRDRVIWTHLLEGRRASGFVLLQSSEL